MNKRSATLIAAAIVAAMTIGGTAFAMGLTGPAASATERPAPAGEDPFVRTRTTTIVVHRQAPSVSPSVVQVSSSNSGPSDSSGPGHEGEDEGFEDQHGHEGEDDQGQHEGDDDSNDHGGGDDGD
jgi:hypothetical protein